MPSRIDSLQGPSGARGFPFLLLLLVLSLAVGSLLVGLLRLHWAVIVLVPVASYTLWVMVRVASAMRRDANEKKVEEEEGR